MTKEAEFRALSFAADSSAEKCTLCLNAVRRGSIVVEIKLKELGELHRYNVHLNCALNLVEPSHSDSQSILAGSWRGCEGVFIRTHKQR